MFAGGAACVVGLHVTVRQHTWPEAGCQGAGSKPDVDQYCLVPSSGQSGFVFGNLASWSLSWTLTFLRVCSQD